ncbi:MAG: signal peptidase II [Propionibacteriaceae bacterium]|nr:signal peptidase II [Propionibacteriaceae bacterium]
MIRRRMPLMVILAIIVVGVIVDQITKALAVAYLEPGQPVSIISDFFQLQLHRNPGAAFSTGTSFTLVFAILALVVLVAVSIFVIPKVESMIWAITVGLGTAGVLGNFIDRLSQPPAPFGGYVIDFFAVKYFAVFNVADIFLTTSAFLIVIITLVVKVDFAGNKYKSSHADGKSAELAQKQE